MTMHVVQGRDGLARRAFSAEDVRRMLDAGIFGPSERVELIEGELVGRPLTVADLDRMVEEGIVAADENVELIEGDLLPMAAKYHVHERIKSALVLAIAPVLPNELWIGIESSIKLSDTTLVEPDIVIYRRALNLSDVRGPDILLAIEVADTTLAFDKGRKAEVYARAGIRELWVVDANQRVTWVHRSPSPKGFGEVIAVAPEEELRAEAADMAWFSVHTVDLG
jgi:Uma2 family endonuclease